MRAFLEKIEKEWLDDFVYISRYPLLELGVDVIPFDGTKLSTLEQYSFNINKDILVGSVQACELFFIQCGIEPPKYLGYPEELTEFLDRKIETISSDKLTTNFPYFVKPKDGVKLFTGTLVENEKELNFLKTFYIANGDIELLLSEPKDFVSEYRCFVHKGVLKGIQWYRGDFTKFPNVYVIKKMIEAYKTSPVSYTLDVGVVMGEHIGGSSVIERKTVLVEVNDMWAIGSYGFNGKDYVRMTIDRFQEIAKTGKKL